MKNIQSINSIFAKNITPSIYSNYELTKSDIKEFRKLENLYINMFVKNKNYIITKDVLELCNELTSKIQANDYLEKQIFNIIIDNLLEIVTSKEYTSYFVPKNHRVILFKMLLGIDIITIKRNNKYKFQYKYN